MYLRKLLEAWGWATQNDEWKQDLEFTQNKKTAHSTNKTGKA
jgi:hypothetical protein